jgi:hypothetical protein
MKFGSLGPAMALLCAIGALCGACATGGGGTASSDDSSAPDVTADGSPETSAPADSSPGLDSSGSSPDSGDDSPDDSIGSLSDSPADTTAPTSDAGDGSTTSDSSSLDTGAADVAVQDTGADAPPDASSCSAGPSPSYQMTCTTCSISATCLLTCASCTKKDQTQNPNPTIQLPCPGATSVSNDDGVLVCS